MLHAVNPLRIESPSMGTFSSEVTIPNITEVRVQKHTGDHEIEDDGDWGSAKIACM